MDTDIKLVDLRKESLNNVKEAIRLASAMGAKGFKLFVNPTFVRNGLVNGKIVPLSIEVPPKSQLLLNLLDLRNLKKAIDFAKKMLVDDGEATVEEKDEPVYRPAPPVVAPLEVVKDDKPETTLDAVVDTAPEEPVTDSAQEVAIVAQPPETSKKRSRKKATPVDLDSLGDTEAPEESE